MQLASGVLVTFLVAVGASAAAQQAGAPPAPAQAPATPLVFEAGVDVVAVDASVLGKDGRPLLDLGTDDFSVQVDGKPRRLVSVEYLGREIEPAAAPAAKSAHFSTNEDAPRGRLVLLIVDRGNIGRGGGREALASADRFVANLAPADRVGLLSIPATNGGSIEFGSDKDALRRNLKTMLGTAPRVGYQVPLSAAIAYAKTQDRFAWNEFVQLACGNYSSSSRPTSDDPNNQTPTQYQRCARLMEDEAAQVYLNYRERSLLTQRTLASVFAALKDLEGPKTVVLVSEGLGTESETEVRDLATAASQAQVTLYVVLVNTGSAADAEFYRTELARSEDRELEAEGLYSLAGHSRGLVLNAIASGDGAFRRISQELMGYYLLGFEPEPGDRDGRSHAVRVSVSRPGAAVRARTLLSIPAAQPTHEAMLVSALRSPIVDRGLAIHLTAYALHGGRPGKAKVLISARIGRAGRPLSVAFSLSDAAGKVSASRAYEGIESGDGDWTEFTADATVDAGVYTLRLAAVDASGRRGSVEHTVKAVPLTAGGVEVSDLVLAASSAKGAVRPAVDLELAGGGLTALVEVGGRDAARVARAAVAVELADTPDGPALLRVPVELHAPRPDGVREASVGMAAGLLPPGSYTARAEVTVDGKPVAAVTRPFRIAATRGRAGSSAPLASLLSEPPAFDKSELLAAAPLGRYVDRVFEIVGGPVPAALAAARDEARGGRPETALDRLAAVAREDPRAAFLRGVSLLARGEVPAALTQLQSASRQSSELFPAAVYMGACHAAAGRDMEAIGAWQTALVGEGEGTPVLYALLSDALLRVREPQQAIDMLSEGLGSFPDDPGLRRRLALANASAGHTAEALPLLTAWVEQHPADNEALLTTLALLFDGFSREATGGAASDERARLVRFARTYVEGNGPNREVIGRWLKYLTGEAGS